MTEVCFQRNKNSTNFNKSLKTMNMKKILLSCIFALAALTVSFAHGDKPSADTHEDLRAEIIALIGHPKMASTDTKDRVTVNFLINAKNEIVILSTTNGEYDDYLKSKLNYQKLVKSTGVINKQYALPLVIQNR